MNTLQSRQKLHSPGGRKVASVGGRSCLGFGENLGAASNRNWEKGGGKGAGVSQNPTAVKAPDTQET